MRRRRPSSPPSSAASSITWCQIALPSTGDGNAFPHTSPKWPASAAILLAQVIRHLATSSCGEGSPDSPISNWDFAWRSLWVIESADGRLHATADVVRAVSGSDLSFVCVGTPSEAGGAPDLHYVQGVCTDRRGAAACLPVPYGRLAQHDVAGKH